MSEGPGLVGGVPAWGRGHWKEVIFKVPSAPNHSMLTFQPFY